MASYQCQDAVRRSAAHFGVTPRRGRPGNKIGERYPLDPGVRRIARLGGIARGITDQDNRDGPELLSSVNPSFTWVRLAQRIPVRIRLTQVPEGVLVSAGMTCTVIMKDGMQPRIGASMKSLMSRAAMVVQTTVARGDTR
jgi:multidrug resistance efflux pump